MQGQQARTRGSPFAILNGATAQDVLCVYVPDGVQLEKPIHVVFIPTGTTMLPLVWHTHLLYAWTPCLRQPRSRLFLARN